MEKVIRDGKVAVLYSPNCGAGWYSWHEVEELLFDPFVVDIVLEHRAKHPRADLPPTKVKEIVRYCKERYGGKYFGAANDLDIVWMPAGTEFRVEEYDGSEVIEAKDDYSWVTA